MDSYRIELGRSAEKDLRKLDRQIIPRILVAIEALEQNPRPEQCRKLVGSEYAYRIRVGDYRIIYTVEEALCRVSIQHIRHRKDAYK